MPFGEKPLSVRLFLFGHAAASKVQCALDTLLKNMRQHVFIHTESAPLNRKGGCLKRRSVISFIRPMRHNLELKYKILHLRARFTLRARDAL